MSVPESTGADERRGDGQGSALVPPRDPVTADLVITDASTDAVAADAEWRRLDKRMLLIHPVRELTKYIPVLIGAVIVGSQSDNPAWSPVVAGIIVVIALARWFTAMCPNCSWVVP